MRVWKRQAVRRNHNGVFMYFCEILQALRRWPCNRPIFDVPEPRISFRVYLKCAVDIRNASIQNICCEWQIHKMYLIICFILATRNLCIMQCNISSYKILLKIYSTPYIHYKYLLTNNCGWLSNSNNISEIGSSQETQKWCKTFNFDIEFINNCTSSINWR